MNAGIFWRVWCWGWGLFFSPPWIYNPKILPSNFWWLFLWLIIPFNTNSTGQIKNYLKILTSILIAAQTTKMIAWGRVEQSTSSCSAQTSSEHFWFKKKQTKISKLNCIPPATINAGIPFSSPVFRHSVCLSIFLFWALRLWRYSLKTFHIYPSWSLVRDIRV